MRGNPTLIAFTDVCASVEVAQNVNGSGGICVVKVGVRLGITGFMF